MMRAYKWVDERYATSFAQGYARVGTLEGYRQLEGERSDPGEGTATTSVKRYVLTPGDVSQTAANIRKMNLAPPHIGLRFENCTFQKTMQDLYVFCVAATPHGTIMDDKGYALFLIRDFVRFCSCLFGNIAEPHGSVIIGKIDYASRYNDVSHPDALNANPFLKPLCYKYEHEIRAISVSTTHDIAATLVHAPENSRIIKRLK